MKEIDRGILTVVEFHSIVFDLADKPIRTVG